MIERRKKILFTLITIGVVLVPIVAGELALRWEWNRAVWKDSDGFPIDSVFVPSEDPELGYGVQPNRTLPGKEEPVHINEHGYRDDPFGFRGEEAYRIALLGDSVGWGWGVDTSKSFPWRLEYLLNEGAADASRAVEVLNFSVEGYSTEQEARLIETKVLEFDPDLAIVAYVLNDPDEVDGGLLRYFQPPKIYWKAAIERFIRNWRANSIGRKGAGYPEVAHTMYREEILKNLDRFAEVSKREGLPVLFAILPAFHWEETYAEVKVHRWLKQQCQKRGLLVFDLWPTFRVRDPNDLAFDVWHPNEEGHRLIAEALSRHLVMEDLVP